MTRFTSLATLALTLGCSIGCGSTENPRSAPAAPGGSAGTSAALGGETSGGQTSAGATSSSGGEGGSLPAGGGVGGSVSTTIQFTNYQVTGSWPELQADVAQAPGKLSYQKIQVSDLFLAESCAIADYNDDGQPDISSGRRWYQGPDFTVEHIYRDGHEELPRDGLGQEIDTGISDDWADFAWDMNGDGFADIINIANVYGGGFQNPNPAPAALEPGSAYWYQNPASGWEADPKWERHLIHDDLLHEQRGIVDVNGDGKPEIFGACRGCNPNQTKGYYSADWTDTTKKWTYTPITGTIEFPFGGTGLMHGLGFGDVNGDSLPDMLDREGIWMQDPNGGPWQLLKFNLYDGDPFPNRGGAHMYAWDIDGDGDQDVFSADWAHGEGLAWYEQTPGGAQPFIKHQFMGSLDELANYTVYFTEPHAVQVVDMDGDGVRDIVTGKKRYAHPNGYGDPDLEGAPVVYVFRTVREQAGVSGAAHFEPFLVDDVAGVGSQIGIGHANLDGILDICVATKVGIYVFLGQ